MRRHSYIINAIVLTSLVIVACSKVGSGNGDDPNAIDPGDKVPPVITVTKPTDNQVYATGDSIIVQGKTTDDRVVYKGKINLINDATNAVVAEANYESHTLTAIDFRLAYKAIVTAQTSFTVYVEFQDHGFNTVSSTLKVKVNP